MLTFVDSSRLLAAVLIHDSDQKYLVSNRCERINKLLSFLVEGFLFNFISFPVLKGFRAAAGVTIFMSRLKVSNHTSKERIEN